MKENLTPDDLIVRNILAQVEDLSAENIDESDLDYELLAMFVEGCLDDDQRLQVLQQLDGDPSARETVSLLIAASQPSAVRTKPNSWSGSRAFMSVFAAAAILLLAAALYWPRISNRIAEARVYDEAVNLLDADAFERAEASLDTASQKGIASDRLRSLHVQAVLHSSQPVALASRGQLTDLGFDIHGAASRDPAAGTTEALAKAKAILNEMGDDLGTALKNRGYLLLQLGETDAAVAHFQSLSKENDSPLVLIGLGLASYMAEDYSAAEAAFRRCLERDADNTAARINLAMTLTEQGKLQQAVEMWQSVPASAVTPDMQRQIAEEVEALKRVIDNQPDE